MSVGSGSLKTDIPDYEKRKKAGRNDPEKVGQDRLSDRSVLQIFRQAEAVSPHRSSKKNRERAS